MLERRAWVAGGFLALGVIVAVGIGPSGPPPARGERGAWAAHVRVVDEALADGRIDVAVRLWHDAYGAALADDGWESLIAAGEAFVRIGRASRATAGARINARVAYGAALARAERQGSIDGVLRSAAAFRQIGDAAAAERCLAIAAQLASGDGDALERVREAREGWTPAPSAGS